MTAKDIYKKIEKLGNNSTDEEYVRNKAQELLLTIEDYALSPKTKSELITDLRKALRSVLKLDCSVCDIYSAEINSLLEELCLAADFYLLEKEKRINLFPESSNVFIRLNPRAFENCFYGILSILLKCSDEITVQVKGSKQFCTLIFRAENSITLPPEALLNNMFFIFENGQKCLCLKTKRCFENQFPPVEEDFSLLLGDRMSSLQIWMCDV